LSHCLPCEATCCKVSDSIGSPILSEDEASKIEKISKRSTRKVESPTGQEYYTLLEREDGKCYLLTRRNRCRAQKAKPLDCLSYPIKAVYGENSVEFILDPNCPASEHLTEEFIQSAKIVALDSMARFDSKTYNHWLENNVGWVKMGVIEHAFPNGNDLEIFVRREFPLGISSCPIAWNKVRLAFTGP